jgi:hypothetical protein
MGKFLLYFIFFHLASSQKNDQEPASWAKARPVTSLYNGNSATSNSRYSPLRTSVKIQGKEFVIFTEKMDWTQAAKKCRQEGMELAKVNTVFQSTRIFAFAKGFTWIGLRSKNGMDGIWRWMSGEKAEHSEVPWGKIQPNDAGDYLCAYIAVRAGSVADTHCRKLYKVACTEVEKDRKTSAKTTIKKTTTKTTATTTTTTTTTTTSETITTENDSTAAYETDDNYYDEDEVDNDFLRGLSK